MDTAPVPASEEFEYLRVEVTRTESTELYLKVPKGWKPTGRDDAMLGRAAKQTTEDSDWDSYDWPASVELQQGHVIVSEKEANSYRVYDVVADIGTRAPVAI